MTLYACPGKRVAFPQLDNRISLRHQRHALATFKPRAGSPEESLAPIHLDRRGLPSAGAPPSTSKVTQTRCMVALPPTPGEAPARRSRDVGSADRSAMCWALPVWRRLNSAVEDQLRRPPCRWRPPVAVRRVREPGIFRWLAGPWLAVRILAW